MSRILIIFSFLLFCCLQSLAQPNQVFLSSNGTQSASVKEVQDFYNFWLSKKSHLRKGLSVTLNAQDNLVSYEIGASNQQPDSTYVTLLINNAIHAGEPDGVDATMLLLNELMTGKFPLPKHVRLIILPFYNMNGLQNRNSTTRANQNGPDIYGFRANGQYLDLNRDMMKADAIESNFMQELLVSQKVDVLVDNHVSNGADYQHIITLLTSQKDKYEPTARDFIHQQMERSLYTQMKKRNYDLCPYVNHFSETPENGWQEFYESPRFVSGFASMFNIYAFVVETHMLKPYKQRVEATYSFLQEMINYCENNYKAINISREKALQEQLQATTIKLNFQCDTSYHEMIRFNGYTPGYKPSAISGLPRLYYDRAKPFSKSIPFYNHFVPKDSVRVPDAYIIPKEWLMKFDDKYLLKQFINSTSYFAKDTILTLSYYTIDNYATTKSPYEGHYLHYNTSVSLKTEKVQVHAGDLIIRLQADKKMVEGALLKKCLVQLLEPVAEDSYFNWNFFDPILQQKEGYSDYVFEDLAAEELKQNPSLAKALEEAKLKDTNLAQNGGAQLNWVYQHSIYREPGYKRYPILRWNY